MGRDKRKGRSLRVDFPTVVHIAVAFGRVQLDRSQVVFLCLCLLSLKGEKKQPREKISSSM